MVGASLFVGLIAQISIPLWPVPITGQTLAVLLVGAVLGSRRAGVALTLYLIEGVAGLPFFAGGSSGWATVTGPTGGYILGFIIAAYLVGYLAERGWDRGFIRAAVAMLIGNIVIYIVGLPWLHMVLTQRGIEANVLGVGLFPFVLGDFIKLAIAAAVLPSAWAFVNRMGISGSRGRIGPPG